MPRPEFQDIEFDKCGNVVIEDGSLIQPPTEMLQGVAYEIMVPVIWNYPPVHYRTGVRFDWISMAGFTFGLEIDGAAPIKIAEIPAHVIGVQDQIAGSYIFPVYIPGNLSIGSHMLHLHAESHGYYRQLKLGWMLYGEAESNRIGWRTEVVSGAPDAYFVAIPHGTQAPLRVDFRNYTTWHPDAPAPSYSWDFGDGGSSTEAEPSHIFALPGDYEVVLTATNDYGSDTHTETITVEQAPVSPFFDRETSWHDSATGPPVDEPFRVQLVIENQGGPGNIYVRARCEGRITDIISSMHMDGYSTYTHPLIEESVDYYLGSLPDRTTNVQIMFETGPVGQEPTDRWSTSVVVYVKEVPDEEEGIPWLTYGLIGGGVLVTGVAAYALLRRRK